MTKKITKGLQFAEGPWRAGLMLGYALVNAEEINQGVQRMVPTLESITK